VKRETDVQHFEAQKKSKGIFSPIFPVPKKHLFLEGFQACSVCPSGESNT